MSEGVGGGVWEGKDVVLRREGGLVRMKGREEGRGTCGKKVLVVSW